MGTLTSRFAPTSPEPALRDSDRDRARGRWNHSRRAPSTGGRPAPWPNSSESARRRSRPHSSAGTRMPEAPGVVSGGEEGKERARTHHGALPWRGRAPRRQLVVHRHRSRDSRPRAAHTRACRLPANRDHDSGCPPGRTGAWSVGPSDSMFQYLYSVAMPQRLLLPPNG